MAEDDDHVYIDDDATERRAIVREPVVRRLRPPIEVTRTSTMQQQCGRRRGHDGPHAVEAPGEGGIACLAPAGEVLARTDVVCVAAGEVHRVDVGGRVACGPSLTVLWLSEPSDLVAAVTRIKQHHLCLECFPAEGP